MKPPCAIRWPFTICGCTIIESVASPGLISTIVMPRPLLASSSFHIASAQARAMSSGESLALTFTRLSWLDVIVVDLDLVRNRLGLAGHDENCLQLPRLQRIVHVHLGLALDELGPAGRAHAALAGKRQIDAAAQRRIENGFAL